MTTGRSFANTVAATRQHCHAQSGRGRHRFAVLPCTAGRRSCLVGHPERRRVQRTVPRLCRYSDRAHTRLRDRLTALAADQV